ncbi:hypothetical protein LCGC14_0408200 [marine sediment metagenome]|uniref:Peptidoglycan-binding protein n=2 Tax=root TaxID=1 RepID=A0A7V1BHH8_9RHOB|nr:peptidoglycan-binding domain-containing protein [Sulfitobacter litoralis]HDZ53038.1 peptidoglycan-binding protein [Sulfitobacter litoralis]
MAFQASEGGGCPRHLDVSGQKRMNAAALRSGCTALLTVLAVAVAPVALAQGVNNSRIKIDQIRPPTAPGVKRRVALPRKMKHCVQKEEGACLDLKTVRNIQSALNILGYDAGVTDGIYGANTSRAFEAFQMAHGKPTSFPPSSSEIQNILRIAQSVQDTPRARYHRDVHDLRKLPNIAVQITAPHVTISAETQPASAGGPPVPTRVFAGPGQFPPENFRGYGVMTFIATASEYDFGRHMIFCQAYMNSLPVSASVAELPGDQFVTVWPLTDADLSARLNRTIQRADAVSTCKQAIDSYDANHARNILTKIRKNEGFALDGLGPYLFGWIPADDFDETGKLILMLDLSRVSTYEQALIQLQSWQQKIVTNPELLQDGLSIENLRRLVRDWSDQHGQAFLVLIGAG